MAQKYYNVKESGRGRTITELKKYLALEVDEISPSDYIKVTQLTTVDAVAAFDLPGTTGATATAIAVEIAGATANQVNIGVTGATGGVHAIFLVVGV